MGEHEVRPYGDMITASIRPTAMDILQFPLMESPTCSHGIFTRHGGVSPGPWDSLNVGYQVGDRTDNVAANRERIKKKLGLAQLVGVCQVHGNRVLIVESATAAGSEAEGYDALITNVPGVGLLIQQADCQAVLLLDPVRRAVGIAHAGWRGSVANIIARTVAAMTAAFGTRPADLLAGVSPSLGPCCAEFINFRTELPESLHRYQTRPAYFDFWRLSRDQLQAAGVPTANIGIAGICTKCDRNYFSYRREKHTGRCGSVIAVSL